MRNMGLGSWMERRGRISPARRALWFEGRSWTYQELATRVRKVGTLMQSLGVRRGDRVAYLGLNQPAVLETLFACGAIGAIWVPVNARLTVPEIEYILSDSGSVVVVHGEEHGAQAGELARRLSRVTAWVQTEGDPSPPSISYEGLLDGVSAPVLDHPVSLDDGCLIMYTSGTTGDPKGALLTHGNMTWNGFNQLIDIDIAPDEKTMAMAPMFHVGGLNGTVTPTLLRGGTVVAVRRIDPPAVLKTIEEQEVSSFFAVPTMLDMLSGDPAFATTDFSRLRTIGVGGAPLPIPTLRRWSERGVVIQQVYGMTEASPSGTALDAPDAERKQGSAGKMAFFTDVRVVNPDGGEVAPGQVGEVILQGPNIMAGYWGRPDDTDRVLRDGWFHSGDAATVDEDGYLYLRDRYKDMIISGGENVYPAEVESALLEIEGVAEAAVIGVPDERWGEVGLAVIVLGPAAPLDASGILSALDGRLARFKIPKHVRFVADLPRTASGKLRKNVLREQIGQDAGSQVPGRRGT